jgi:hypothetical protein
MRHQKLSSGLNGVGGVTAGLVGIGSGVFKAAFTTGPRFRARGRGGGIGEGLAVAMTTLDGLALAGADALLLPVGTALLATAGAPILGAGEVRLVTGAGLRVSAGGVVLAMVDGLFSGRRCGRGAAAIRWDCRLKWSRTGLQATYTRTSSTMMIETQNSRFPLTAIFPSGRQMTYGNIGTLLRNRDLEDCAACLSPIFGQ